MTGNQVTGSWEEKTYSAKGEVTGRYSGEGFVLSIQGANFTAAMNVALSSCKQSISITPKGLDVTNVTISARQVLAAGAQLLRPRHSWRRIAPANVVRNVKV